MLKLLGKIFMAEIVSSKTILKQGVILKTGSNKKLIGSIRYNLIVAFFGC